MRTHGPIEPCPGCGWVPPHGCTFDQFLAHIADNHPEVYDFAKARLNEEWARRVANN